MAENINAKKSEHLITLSSRKTMRISGVCELIGFDSFYVELESICGRVYIDGEDIKIIVLDTENGNVELSGKISAITYSDKEGRAKRGLFKRSHS